MGWTEHAHVGNYTATVRYFILLDFYEQTICDHESIDLSRLEGKHGTSGKRRELDFSSVKQAQGPTPCNVALYALMSSGISVFISVLSNATPLPPHLWLLTLPPPTTTFFFFQRGKLLLYYRTNSHRTPRPAGWNLWSRHGLACLAIIWRSHFNALVPPWLFLP